MPLLDDPAEELLAVSAFNDNGLDGLVSDNLDAAAVLRSDFFPGLGWMLTAPMWAELRPIWPAMYWDDWLRGPDVRKRREVLRPEVPRTLHFGVRGTCESHAAARASSSCASGSWRPARSSR